MLLADVHAHLDHNSFNSDLNSVVDRAEKAGVKVIINNGIDIESNRKTLEISEKYAIVKPALGLYPIEALKLSDGEIDDELSFIDRNKRKIIAIGEIGLDYHWEKDKNQIKRQQKIFEKIISLAEKTKKPVIVHSRNAEQDVFEMLNSSKIKKVVIHCFGGSLKLAKDIADNGFFFSIPTNIVKSGHMQKLVEQTNINQLLTETDCPYLSPFPEKRNEPAFVAEALKKIAEIKGFNEEETANSVFMNYERSFL